MAWARTTTGWRRGVTVSALARQGAQFVNSRATCKQTGAAKRSRLASAQAHGRRLVEQGTSCRPVARHRVGFAGTINKCEAVEDKVLAIGNAPVASRRLAGGLVKGRPAGLFRRALHFTTTAFYPWPQPRLLPPGSGRAGAAQEPEPGPQKLVGLARQRGGRPFGDSPQAALGEPAGRRREQGGQGVAARYRLSAMALRQGRQDLARFRRRPAAEQVANYRPGEGYPGRRLSCRCETRALLHRRSLSLVLSVAGA